ncbi:hypothetical protein OsI_17420 [Oryza sativa Indica Group]|uniref:Uncharacterized protein n=1 Tax=Oryza sativa subsp. indica TaxID=39946 RepID=A2XXL2_ORYSI|nr:hypothetical protein OsI_17420 [Oryza sativa Indica Group]
MPHSPSPPRLSHCERRHTYLTRRTRLSLPSSSSITSHPPPPRPPRKGTSYALGRRSRHLCTADSSKSRLNHVADRRRTRHSCLADHGVATGNKNRCQLRLPSSIAGLLSVKVAAAETASRCRPPRPPTAETATEKQKESYEG